MNPTSPDILILTGAGISAESGLATFRDPNGIWAKYKVEDVATPQAFRRNPHRVQDFYNLRRRQLLSEEIRPNAAHLALARLEREWRGQRGVLVVTQNIDDLHERAGQRRVLHMHGELLKSRCVWCEEITECRVDLDEDSQCPACEGTSALRPHVVWFGEMPLFMDEIAAAAACCRLFISIGTSGKVYPAAGLVAEAGAAGATTLELNLEPSAGATRFHECRHGPATEVVPQAVEEILANPDKWLGRLA